MVKIRQVHFWTTVYPSWSYVITPVSGPSVGQWSVFRYLRDSSLVFSETLHEVEGQLSKKKVTRLELKKKLIHGLRGIKAQKLGFLDFSSK